MKSGAIDSKLSGRVGAVILVLSAFVLLSLPGAARAEMGSVWTTGVTTSSVTIEWSAPSGAHRLGSNVPTYVVSWEVDNFGGYPYNLERVERTVNGEPRYTITELEAETVYRIRVEAVAEKNVLGEWINPKQRQVGVVTQRTRGASGRTLSVTSSTESAIQLDFTNATPEEFDVVRIAYKERGNADIALNVTAADPIDPLWENDAVRGFHDVASAAAIRVEFTGLDRATEYEVVAYGLRTGPTPGTKIGRATARTAGTQPLTTVPACIAVDHEDILDLYAFEMSAEGAESLFDEVAGEHPELHEARAALSSDEGIDLGEGDALLKYLIEQRPALFEEWQTFELEDDRRSLVAFVSTLYQRLWLDLSAELDADPTPFVRGDCNIDGSVDISDARKLLDVLYRGEGRFSCLDAADTNDSGAVDLSDAAYLLNFLFLGAAAPKAPFGACGTDPTNDPLGCVEYWSCQ